MKPFYTISVALVISFTIIGTVATIFLYDSADDSNNEIRSNEELASELDKALGVAPTSENESVKESSTADEGEKQPADRKNPDNEEHKQDQTEEAISEANDSSELESISTNDDVVETALESKAISLGQDDESIPIDELIQRLK